MSKKRFASKEVFQIFVVCALPVHVWAIVHILYELPGLILQMDAWKLTGFIAYTLTFVLFESLVIFLFVMLLGLIIPSRWMGQQFVAQASVLVFATSAWMGFLHWKKPRPDLWQPFDFVWLGGVYLAALGGLLFLVRRFPGLDGMIRAIINRLAVLSSVYFFFDILGVLIVIIRNIGGA